MAGRKRVGRPKRPSAGRGGAGQAGLQGGAVLEVPVAMVANKTDDAADELNLKGIAHGDRGRISKAVRCFEEVLRRFPDHYAANSNMGMCMLGQGKPDRALEYYARAAESMPSLPSPHYNKGRALLALCRFDEAVESLGEALRLSPSFLPAKESRAEALAAAGRTGESIKEYDEIKGQSKSKRGRFIAVYNKGSALLANNRVAEAMECYNEAIAMEPNEPGPHSGLGHAYARFGKFGMAIKHYRRTISLAPRDPRAYANIASCLSNRGKFKRALEYVNKALEVDPAYAYGHSLKAQILVQASDSGDRHDDAEPEAMDSLLRAIALDGRFAKDPLGRHKSGAAALREGAS